MIGKLFWRMFFGLWLGSTVLMIGSAVFIALVTQREVPELVRKRVEQMLRTSAESAILLHDRMNADQFSTYLLSMQHKSGMMLYLLDERGRELLDRRLPPDFDYLNRNIHTTPGVTPDRHGVRPAGLYFHDILADAEGRHYRVLMSFQGPEFPSAMLLLQGLSGPLLLSVLLAGFFSALSARYLIKPINRLRVATSRLASGELEYRIGDSLSARHDEFSVLARDFDRMAGQISSLIGTQRRLMQDLSHELRSPLARLRVALELQRGPNPRQDLLDRMERDTDRMDILIGELLLLARLESPESEPERILIDLRELVNDIVEDAQLEIASQPRTLSCANHGVQIEVYGDRELLRRAIENIVRNALKHTPETADIDVVVERIDNRARILVVDGGNGIPAEIADRIFTPFVRGEDARGGNGLGLTIARAAVQRHGGSIVIAKRERSSGMTVTMLLPLASEASATPSN